MHGAGRGQNLSLHIPGFYEMSRHKVIQLWATVRQPNVFLPTLFLFLWQGTPQSDSAMFFFTYVSDEMKFDKYLYNKHKFLKPISNYIPFHDARTNKLHFTPEFLGRVKLVTSVASLVGVGIYNGFLKNVPLRKIFLATTIIGAALRTTQVHPTNSLKSYAAAI